MLRLRHSLLPLCVLSLLRTHVIATGSSCSDSSSVVWSRDTALDGVMPNSSFPRLTRKLNVPDRHECMRISARMTVCVAFIYVREESLCFLLGRRLSTEDLQRGLLQPLAGALYFFDLRIKCAEREDYTLFVDEGVCLKFHPSLLLWGEAREVCQGEGGDLATAKTPEKINQLFILDADGGSFHAGAWSANGTALWVDNTTLTSRYVRKTPDDVTQNHFIIRRKILVATNVPRRISFICELVVGS